MTYSTREAGPRPAGQRIHALLSGRLPILITFGCLIIVNWAMALWLIQRTWQAQESALSQMINAESQYAGQMISRVFQDADRRLSQLRALRPDDELRSEFARWTRTGHSGGVALIAPDGRVLAASASQFWARTATSRRFPWLAGLSTPMDRSRASCCIRSNETCFRVPHPPSWGSRVP